MEGIPKTDSNEQVSQRLEVKVEGLENKVSEIKSTLEKISDVMISVAEERVRVDNVEKTFIDHVSAYKEDYKDLNQRTRAIESYKWVLIIGGLIFTGVLTGFSVKLFDLIDVAKQQPAITEERLVELVSKATVETMKKQEGKEK